ncbi:MAG: helix-turn-helix domain-containing protein, partial [Bradyrhizobium sp.]|nr:helix-turn-helix domain-containing protein [Bradyrhizobium sp.]
FLSLYWGSELAKRKDESIDAAIGARIRSLRLHQGLTQETLAGKLGITFQQIQKYEQGKNQVNPTRLLKFANIFGVSAGFLLGERQLKSQGAQLPAILTADVDKDAVRMFEAFQQITDRRLRRQLSVLAERIARAGENA